MVRNYKSKTDRPNIDEATMRQALRDVLSKSKSQREAARVYGIKRQTLQSRINKICSTMTVGEYLQRFDDDGYESNTEGKGK